MVKKSPQTQSASRTKHVTAHGLLVSLSYWGTTARMMSMFVLLVCAYVLNISIQTQWQEIDAETIFLIYGFCTLFVFDAGYVMVARSLRLRPVIDRWVIAIVDICIAGFFVIPSFVYVSVNANQLRVVSLFFALLILSIRLLLGLLFAKRKET